MRENYKKIEYNEIRNEKHDKNRKNNKKLNKMKKWGHTRMFLENYH